jgi:mannose-6-phosphate isomerase-like protein (cupin superfamily)
MTDTTTPGREEQHAQYTVSSRKWIADGRDVSVKEFTLAAGEEVPWHHHTEVFDVFYCIEGQMRIGRIDLATQERLADEVLGLGDSVKIEVGTAHRPYNPGPGRLRFVLVQGVGHYDYIPYKLA